MIVTVIALLIGIMLLAAGAYYLAKEKQDAESKKIYMITLVIGVVLAAGALVKLFLLG